MFRKVALAATWMVSSALAATAADAPRPAVLPTLSATPSLQGWLGARYGGLWVSGSDAQGIDEKTAAVNTPLARGNFELEGRGAGFFLSGSSSAAAMGAGHLYIRSSDTAFGGFGGVEVTPSNSHGFAFAGLEAKSLRGPLVFYGQAAFDFATDTGVQNIWWARGGVQVFTTDSLMLEGDVRYAGGGISSWLVSGSAEFRRPGHAWAWHATLNYQTAAGSAGQAATSVLGGVKVHLGNSTLYQAYTTGAVWNLLPIVY